MSHFPARMGWSTRDSPFTLLSQGSVVGERAPAMCPQMNHSLEESVWLRLCTSVLVYDQVLYTIRKLESGDDGIGVLRCRGLATEITSDRLALSDRLEAMESASSGTPLCRSTYIQSGPLNLRCMVVQVHMPTHSS